MSVANNDRARPYVLQVRTTVDSRDKLTQLQDLVSVRLGTKLSLAQTLEVVLNEALQRESVGANDGKSV